MAFMRALAPLLIFALAACAPRVEAPINVTASLAIHQHRLANGLVVVLNPDPSATSALVHVRYHAGAKDDPIGRAGLAHLVEHLTFAAPPGARDLDRYASLERVGAVEVNGATSFDFTDYYETVPPPVLEYALWVEASRMAHPIDRIDEQAVRTELAVVSNELRFRAGSHAYGLAKMLLTETLFGKSHPYGRIASMARGEIDDVTLAEARRFATVHYGPSNATLVVSGRFEVEEANRLVSRYFGRIPARPSPPRDVLPAPRLGRDSVATFRAPVRARELAMGWVLPPPETDGHDEMVLAVRVMLAELRARLITELRLADDVQLAIDGGHLGSMLVVSVTLHGDASAERTTSEVDRVMSSVASLGRTFEWDGFGQIRLALATSLIVALESPMMRAAGIQYDLEYTGAVRSTAADVARIQGMQPWNVGGATRQFIVDGRRAVVLLEPDAAAPPSGVRR